MKNKLFVMSAASGAGKTTLKDLVIKDFPDIKYSISATTRKPREGEIDGVHYFFKTKEEFEQMIKDDALVEYNLVHGNYYGTPKSFVEKTLAEGNRVLFDLDVFGKVNFDKVYPDATGIFILPPSDEELERRLRGRGTDSEEVIQLRLANAKKEIEFAKTKGKYEYTIVNDDLQKAADELRAILSQK
ncbi:guanylate kinase [Fibrobacter succinogenes subsp. succinogenes S85]|jgi:guanylate kinase|uniref:Guanylate kinase n=2 Tax=Fibrobacter succinogenes TaxID=833 RepID=C9RL68_FIBSS|nr:MULTISPECIES: guanylate kinase [Fibrobacter]MBP5439642.1 guanylate kinase [Fibrobacter sp.]ACX74015.1 guanylate kinase [Fibrobacter succinogenes subsp. succinogenes S85]ADL26003.1 guanylate kinase [Fibrobacter succinogenes subsp. succinogenes S85]MDY6332667.1 guanylate kinase [Fibrobacter sp.]OWV19906.1 guanylate kinase [Fibrobacter sp. UWB4]